MSGSPGSLSKEKLKAELKKRGIPFYSNENKAYYVELYRLEILGYRDSPRSTRYSDINRKSIKSPPVGSSAKQKQAILEHLPEVQRMSDAKIRSKLAKYGENPGPITDTTRVQYEKKLARLMKEPATQSKSFSSREVLMTVGRRTPTPVYDEESFVEEAEYSDDEDGETYRYLINTNYNVRKRQDDSLAQRETSARDVQPFKSPLSRTAHRKQGPDVYLIVRNLILLLTVFAGVFLLYDHYTVPAGEQSLILRGYEIVRSSFFSLYTPLMEYQQLQQQKSVPSKREETPPPEEERGEMETEKTSDMKPPVNGPQKDSDSTSTEQPSGKAQPQKKDAPPSQDQPPVNEAQGTTKITPTE